MGLRRFVIVVAVGLATLASGAAASLAALTSASDDANAVLHETVSVTRHAHDLAVDLHIYERTRDPVVRDRIESTVRNELGDRARTYATSSRYTQELRAEARARAVRYLELTRGEDAPPGARVAQLEACDAAIDRWVLGNLEDADRARRVSARVQRVGTSIAVLTAPLAAAAVVLLGLWLRACLVRPTVTLCDAMERFGRGDLDARAAPEGADEVRRMAAQFNTMADAIARQHAARLAHLAGVAHDLRNPLTALFLSTELVDAEKLGLPPTARRPIAIVRRQIELLARMVDDLLDATRIEAGQLALRLEERDLRTIVRDVAELFSHASRLHEVRVHVPSQRVVVRCDPLRIEQTLSNLVSNAMKYSPRGGLVYVELARVGDTAKISVTDQGVGIPKEDLDGIWEPFGRKGVSTESISGVGLGLWTARRIADAHRGGLSVESTIGRGSTFTLTLPLSAPRATAARRADGGAAADA